MTIETAVQMLGIAALCIAMLVMLVLVVCIIIDYTRGVEEGVGSLADEEREREKEEGRRCGMNEELEAAKKKMHDACIEYLRAALKATNSDEIAVLMLAKDFGNLAEDFTEADFADITAKGGAS